MQLDRTVSFDSLGDMTCSQCHEFGYPFDTLPGVTEAPDATIDGITYSFFPAGSANRELMARGEYSEAYFHALCEIVEKEKPSLIHAASFFHNASVALRLRHKYGIPVIYEVRGLSILSDMSKALEKGIEGLRRFFPRLQRYWEFREEVEIARQVDHLLCITEAAADLYRRLGVPSDRNHGLSQWRFRRCGASADAAEGKAFRSTGLARLPR